MSASDCRLKPGAGLEWAIGGIHLLATVALLMLPVDPAYFKGVLIMVLIMNCWRGLRKNRELTACLLTRDQDVWYLETGQGRIAVSCRTEFIAPALVVVKLTSGNSENRRFAFTPRGCTGEHWRRFHVHANNGIL